MHSFEAHKYSGMRVRSVERIFLTKDLPCTRKKPLYARTMPLIGDLPATHGMRHRPVEVPSLRNVEAVRQRYGTRHDASP